jgi:hypothetical protein
MRRVIGRWMIAVMTVLVSAAGGISAVAAHDEGPATYPVAPDPSECLVRPLAIDAVARIVGTPLPGADAPGPPASASPAAFTIPPGVPANSATAAEVIATLRQVFACTNGGQVLRVYALFTDEFIREFFAQTPLTPEVAAFLAATPRPLPEEQRRIIRGFGDVQILDDGRAGVLIILDEPDDPRAEEPDYAILARVDDRWLVDEIHEDSGKTDGTPTP